MTASRTRHAARSVVLLVVAALLLSGCGIFGSDDSAKSEPSRSASPSASSSSAAPSPSADGAVPAELRSFYTQKLAWKDCDGNQCATLRVPLDYDEPDGRAIRLALLKVPAAEGGKRLGSMVVNPGGPGGSGVEYAQQAASIYSEKLRQSYDVVGFDPRGVGQSTPLRCLSGRALDAYVSVDADPDTPAETRTWEKQQRILGDGCLKRSGALARHISTDEVVRDLDVLRAALGEKKLTYFGASYGTAIGATYAKLFPTRVGRMVLDGALDPRSSLLTVNLVQVKGFEVALRSYVKACVDKGDCFLGSSVDAGVRKIDRLLQQLDRKPLTDGDGLPLNSTLASYGLGYPLYNEQAWPLLDQALKAAFAGQAGEMRRLAFEYFQRSEDGTWNNSTEVFNAVTCLDSDGGKTSAQVRKLLPRFEKASPTFGSVFAYTLVTCKEWPIHTGRVPKAIDVRDAGPIMVVGTTRDPATPLIWAQALHRQLKDSVLVTRDGDGHTGYGMGNSCTDDAVDAYLVDATVPGKDVTCS